MRISDWSSDVCSSDLGAPHIWLPMSPVRAEKLARRASEQGVRLTPPDASFVGGECAGGVRLSIMATTNRDDLERSLRVVAALRDKPDEMVVSRWPVMCCLLPAADAASAHTWFPVPPNPGSPSPPPPGRTSPPHRPLCAKS